MRVAIIGPIGSGKTTILEAFKRRGFKTFETDNFVNKLYEKGQKGFELIKNSKDFGEQFIIRSKVDKGLLGAEVMKNPSKKEQLEELIHPLIKEEIDKYQNIICEIPIFTTSKTIFEFDLVLLIISDLEVATNRLIESRHIPKELIKKLYNWFDLNGIKPDYVIDTSAGIDVYEVEIDNFIEKFNLNDYEL